eukprot:c14085_g2_i1 orf=1-159(-)
MPLNAQRNTVRQATWDSENMDITARVLRSGGRQQHSSSSFLSEEGSAEKRAEE